MVENKILKTIKEEKMFLNKLKIMDPIDLYKLFFLYNLGAYHYHTKRFRKWAYHYPKFFENNIFALDKEEASEQE